MYSTKQEVDAEAYLRGKAVKMDGKEESQKLRVFQGSSVNEQNENFARMMEDPLFKIKLEQEKAKQ